ncbi:uncharacterized protein LOC112086233 [Eutrema salsugineum]|uniref:uncharacterized protein LOC112086233 n=1 Tax=Eutrema salsugineum TaxID=72664 RepID=UPI000CED46C2|nr:uncharacterized protein LOC112086233 [Eutrema salsugineum]
MGKVRASGLISGRVWDAFFDLIGVRGPIDLGIPLNASIASLSQRRHRRHRNDLLTEIENVLEAKLAQLSLGTGDIFLWKHKEGTFEPSFSSKQTWLLIRSASATVPWHSGVWFTHCTPKFSVFTWLAILNRLSTGDRMQSWNVGANTLCSLCNSNLESRDHLFFSCCYSGEIWTKLTKNLLQSSFTTSWNDVLGLLSDSRLDRITLFLFRFSLQATVHSIWRERNSRRHGDDPLPATRILHLIDKLVRCRIQSIPNMGDRRYEDALQTWFNTRV